MATLAKTKRSPLTALRQTSTKSTALLDYAHSETPTAQKGSVNNGGFLGGVGYLFEKAGAGFLSGIEGIWDYGAGGFAKMFGADDWAEEQFANDWVNYGHADEWYNPSDGWQFAGDVAGGIGTSLPAIAGVAAGATIAYFSGGTLSPLAAGIISGSIAGFGAAGNATKEAYEKSGTLGAKEFGYGFLSGATEAGLEMLTTGMAKGSGRIVSSIAKSTAKETTETVAKTGAKSVIKNLVADFATEAFEEGLAEALDPVYQRLTYNPDAENATPQEIAYAALVGGMSGLVMSGGSAAISTGVNHASNLISGNKSIKSGTAASILETSRQLAETESKSDTGYASFQTIQKDYAKLIESLAKTGGEITTARQKMLLGELKRANTTSILMPFVERSAMNILNNTEAVAQRFTEFGMKDASGKALTFTAEAIRAGIDTELYEMPAAQRTKEQTKALVKSIRAALTSNSTLATLAVADATGHITMNTQKIAEAMVNGSNLVDSNTLNYFVENASQSEIAAASADLGITDWSAITIDDVKLKAGEFTTSERGSEVMKQRARIRAASEVAQENTKALPHILRSNMADGVYRFSSAHADVNMAVLKEGDTYHLYDYDSGNISRSLTVQEINKVLRTYWNTQGTAVSAQATRNIVEQNTVDLFEQEKSDLSRQAAEIDSLASQTVPEYKQLSEPNKQAVRMTIRQAQKHGIDSATYTTMARVAARSGLNIIFDGERAFGDGAISGNTIYVNPNNSEARTYEVILGHEMFHKLFADGDKRAMQLFTEARKLLESSNPEKAQEVRERYKKFYKKLGADATTAHTISEEEVAAAGAEEVFRSADAWAYILSKEPSFADKVLSFFRKSAREYSSVQGLSAQARKFVRQYKALFESLAERNQGNNALSIALEGAGAKKMPVTNTETDSMHVTGDNDEEAPIVTNTDVDTDTRFALLTDEDLAEYMATGKTLHTRHKKQRMLENGKKPILTSESEIREFISNAIQGKAGGEVRAFARVPKRLAEAISDVRSTLDLEGDYLEFQADALREAYKVHSSPKMQGDVALSESDFENLHRHIFDFDGVLSVNDYNGKTEVHIYRRAENGYYQIITVSSSERKSLQITKLIGVSKEKFEEKYAKKIERNTGSPRMPEASNPSTKARHTAGALSNGSNPADVLSVVTDESAATSTISITENAEKSNPSDENSSESAPKKRFALPANVEERVLAHFGKTYNWRETGYIFKDGKRLDLSGRNDGAPGGYRSVDHREIFSIEEFENGDTYGTEALIEFMQRGNIRVMPETPGINLILEPTDAQYDKIADMVERLAWKEKYFSIDFDNSNGDTVDNLTYEGNVSARKVIADIKYYFKEGKIPYKSELSQFRYALTDEAYLAAVESGDMAAAQAMVEEAAYRAGYTIKAYHGTTNREEASRWNDKTKTFDTDYKKFTIFKRQYDGQAGFFFASKYDNAGGYGSTVYSTFLNLSKPLEIDCNNQGYDAISFNGMTKSTEGWAEYAKKNGYNGVIFKNVRDGVGYADLSESIEEYVAFYPVQIKSADPITYDKNGNVIPLSKRFDSSNPDIRYAMDIHNDYSYESLTKKPDISVVTLPTEIPMTESGEIDKKAIVARGRLNARKQKNPKNTETSTYVRVNDIGQDVLLSKNGMIHGIARSQETAFAVMRIGDALKNSFAVNELNGSVSRKTEMSYVLLGACRDSENLYVVRSVVSKLQNDVTEIDVYQLGAVKGKKTETPTSALGGTAVAEQSSLISSESPVISIADFLQYVKTIPLANEVFSEDAAKKLGITRSEGYLSGDIRYALSETRTSVMTEVDAEYTPTVKDKVFSGWTAGQIAFTNAQAGIEAYGRQNGIKSIESLVQAARSGRNQAEEMIAGNQYRIGAQNKVYQGEGLEQIFRHISKQGAEVRGDFFDYLFNYHNMSRMSLNERSNAEQAQRQSDLQTKVSELNKLGRKIKKLQEQISKLGRSKKDMETKRGLREQLKTAKEQAKALQKEARELEKVIKAFVPLENKAVLGFTDENGVETVVTAEQSKEIVAKYEAKYPEFKATAEKVWQFLQNLNQYRVDTGLISQDTFDYLAKLYPHYVPTYRTGAKKGIGVIEGKYNLKVKTTIKTATGSTRDLLPPDVMIARQVMETVRAGRINQLANALYEAAEKSGDTTYIEIVSREKISHETLADLDTTELRPKDNEIVFFRDGERLTMRVSKEIFAGFNAFNPEVEIHNPLINGARAINNGFKRLVTSLNPAFLVRNTIRDVQDAGINTRYGKTFIKNYARASYEISHNGKLWQLYKAMGGFSSSVFDFEKGFSGMQNRWGLTKAEGNLLKQGLTAIENANAFVEQLPRLAEFISSLEAGNTAEQAVLDSADVTTNFGRTGTVTKVLNRTLIPFLNPSIQGFSKMIRNITSIRSAKELATFLVKVAIVGIAPQIINMLMYGDDEDYKNLRDNDKENNFLFKVGDTFIKIPRGRVASTIGGLINRTASAAQGEDVDWAGYVENVMQQVTPVDSMSRTIFSPFKDVATNTSWYGSAIEGRQFENTAPKDRYDESTSSIAIAIGQAINYSPKKIHYLLDQYSGVIGDFILPATTAKAEKDFIRGNFTLDAATSNKLSTEFYEMYDKAQYAKTAGDETAAYQVRYLNKVKDAISDMYKQKSEIQNSDLSNADKLQQSRVIQLLINEAYKTAMQDFDLYTKAIEATAGMEDESLRFTEATRLMYGAERALSEYNKDVYAKCQVLNKAGVNYDMLYNYYFTVRGLESDKDSSGNTINGSKRKKVVASIQSLDLKVDQKLLLIAASGYSLQDNDIPRMSGVNAKKRLLRYILSLKGVSQSEKAEIAELCGFEVKNGRIITKNL